MQCIALFHHLTIRHFQFYDDHNIKHKETNILIIITRDMGRLNYLYSIYVSFQLYIGSRLLNTWKKTKMAIFNAVLSTVATYIYDNIVWNIHLLTTMSLSLGHFRIHLVYMLRNSAHGPQWALICSDETLVDQALVHGEKHLPTSVIISPFISAGVWHTILSKSVILIRCPNLVVLTSTEEFRSMTHNILALQCQGFSWAISTFTCLFAGSSFPHVLCRRSGISNKRFEASVT